MKFSINPKINMSLKEFKNLFSDKFKHIAPKLKNAAMKTEYDRMMSERKELDHDAENQERASETNEIEQSIGSKNDEPEAAK